MGRRWVNEGAFVTTLRCYSAVKGSIRFGCRMHESQINGWGGWCPELARGGGLLRFTEAVKS